MIKKIPRLPLSEPVKPLRPGAPFHHRVKHRATLMARHPFAVPVVTILGLMLITGIVLAALSHSPKTINPNVVVISHDGIRETVSSKESTVSALLTKLDLKLGEGDVVEPSLNTKIQQDDFRINIYRAVPVTIIDGEHRTYTFSAASTARSIARQSGLSLFPEDNVSSQPITDFVANSSIGEEVIVERSTPVDMNLYGAPLSLRTTARNVRLLLREKGVKLASKDVVTPSLDTPLTAGLHVAVVRNGIATRTILEDIPTPNQIVYDNSLSYGVSAVRQQGAPGKRAVTYEITTQNGVEVSRRELQVTVTVQPVTQITVQGTNLSGIKGDMALAGISPSDYQYVDYIVSHESGWCPTKAQGQYGSCPPYAGYVPATGGYGLCQSTPGSKMATAGADWATNPVTQLRWCAGYAQGRYGGWPAAYNHWLAYHNW